MVGGNPEGGAGDGRVGRWGPHTGDEGAGMGLDHQARPSRRPLAREGNGGLDF